MSRCQFLALAIDAGLTPAVAARAHKVARRIGANLKAQLARLRDAADRRRAIDAAGVLLDAQILAALAGPSMSVDDGWLQ
jgi:hypothetical protein